MGTSFSMELITGCVLVINVHLVCVGVWCRKSFICAAGTFASSLTLNMGSPKSLLFGERRNDGVHVAIKTLIAVNRVSDDDGTPCSNPVISTLPVI